MHAFQQFNIKGQTLCLSADRSVFWEEHRALIVSDLHIGKTGHFRKAGIAVPQLVLKEDMQRLFSQVQYFKPSALIVVGDMFHSSANKELELFARWRSDMAALRISLIKGNHDILQNRWYADNGIELYEESLTIEPFCFSHDAENCSGGDNADHYVFSGHLHPGIAVNGGGRQTLRFPCFYFSDTYCILPAFSRFTGTVGVKPAGGDVTFAIVNNSLVKINAGQAD